MAILTRTLFTTRFPLMGGQALVRFVHDRGRAEAERIARAVEREAHRIEQKYSRYSALSIVSRINQCAGESPVVVDEETEFLVQSALEMAALTKGRFDPTVGVLRRVWDFKTDRVPSFQELSELMPLVNAGAVSLRNGSVYLQRRGMEIDLGGVGKEYAVDRVAELLQGEGVESAIVNFLGDVRTLGSRSDGRPWSIGVVDPQDPRQCRFTIRAQSGAGVATSGDYERGFLKDGIRYHHILDATTGQPRRGLSSVTVIAPTTSMAGRLATAAFLLGLEEGLRVIENSPSTEGALITDSGEVIATKGMVAISDLKAERSRP